MAGRPRSFATVEELQQGIDNYFAEETANGYPVTVSGLAYALGVDRKTINNYSHEDEFFPTIKKAVAYIEADKAKKMLKGEYNTTAAIFDLKNNHDWKDQKEVNSSVNMKVGAYELTDERLAAIAAGSG